MKKNTILLIALMLFALTMFGFAYANVPLFKMVCQRIGIAVAPNAKHIERTKSDMTGRKIKVRFSGLVAHKMPIVFEADEPLQEIELGKEAQNKYTFTNTSNDTIRFRPVHSVLPEDASAKLQLTKCFCFDDMMLPPKGKAERVVEYTFGADLNPEIEYVTMNYTLFDKDEEVK